LYCFFLQAEDGIRDGHVTGVQTCALPISRGDDVVVADIVAARAEQVEEEIGIAGGRAIATHTDVSAAADVAAMRARAEEAFGGVDVLVNNAAVDGGNDLLEIDEATWDRDLTVCLKSVFLCSKEMLP